MPNFRALTSLVVLYSKDYAAAIRGKYHESSADCFEHPKKSNLYQATKKTWQLFLPTPRKRKKIPGIKNFKPPKILRSSPSLEIRCHDPPPPPGILWRSLSLALSVYICQQSGQLKALERKSSTHS